jgi:LPXTG-site transpeptidase (sortase) family protein
MGWWRKASGGLMRLWRAAIVRRALLVLAPLASAALGAVLVVVLWRGVFGEEGSAEREVKTVPTATAAAFPPPNPAPPSEAPPVRLTIPQIDVDAPLESQTVQANGVMPNPSGPEVVAVYDLSAYHPGQEHRPGFGGNAILSGHVDYIRYGPAVFWDLSELKLGDEVQVLLKDGTNFRYAVVWNEKWSLGEIPWDRLFEINGRDAVTLITCAGSWDGQSYSARRGVRAERIYGPFLDQPG